MYYISRGEWCWCMTSVTRVRHHRHSPRDMYAIFHDKLIENLADCFLRNSEIPNGINAIKQWHSVATIVKLVAETFTHVNAKTYENHFRIYNWYFYLPRSLFCFSICQECAVFASLSSQRKPNFRCTCHENTINHIKLPKGRFADTSAQKARRMRVFIVTNW